MKYWEGIGRRKSTTCRVRIYKDNFDPKINDKQVGAFFKNQEDIDYIESPLKVANKLGSFTYTVKIQGGGMTGWKDAIRLGMARALVKVDETLKPDLRAAGLLTRDPRVVERKKPGLKKARKAPRFSKR